MDTCQKNYRQKKLTRKHDSAASNQTATDFVGNNLMSNWHLRTMTSAAKLCLNTGSRKGKF